MPLHPPLSLAFEEPCFLTLTFNPIHYCGPPPYSQLSGETKALPNMDAFLFPWICAALPWGYHPPPSPSSPPTHTHTLTPSNLPPPVFRRGEKIPGAAHCVTSSMGGNGIQRGWDWGRHSGGHILLRVMLIECKKLAKLKGKWRSKGRY